MNPNPEPYVPTPEPEREQPAREPVKMPSHPWKRRKAA